MNWYVTFRDELFVNHPVLYLILMTIGAVLILCYVYKHEKALAEQYRKDNWRPFR